MSFSTRLNNIQLSSTDDEQTLTTVEEDFLKFTEKLRITTTLRSLSHLKLEILEWGKKKRNLNPEEWKDKYALKLQELLSKVFNLENQLNLENSEIFEAPEITKILSDDPYQHICELNLFFSVIRAWCCVFVFCHLPWLLVLIFLPSSPPPSEDVPSSLVNHCSMLNVFLFGFYIIFFILLGFSLLIASAQAVDNGDNIFMRSSPTLMKFLSFVILLYCVFGIIVVWQYDLWNSTLLSDECIAGRNLTVAVVSFYFLLPLLCLICTKLVKKNQDIAVTSSNNNNNNSNALV